MFDNIRESVDLLGVSLVALLDEVCGAGLPALQLLLQALVLCLRGFQLGGELCLPGLHGFYLTCQILDLQQ